MYSKDETTPTKAATSLREQARELIHKAKESSLPAVVAYRVGAPKEGTEAMTKPDEVCMYGWMYVCRTWRIYLNRGT
jgi:hypothetical protein